MTENIHTPPSDEALVAELVVAYYTAHPTFAVSPALAELCGVDLGAPIPYDAFLAKGGSLFGIELAFRAILPLIHAREAALKADAGILRIGTLKAWRGHNPGTIFIQQDGGEGGEFPEADLEAIWQSYYTENF